MGALLRVVAIRMRTDASKNPTTHSVFPYCVEQPSNSSRW